jgi:hypothetical protein
MTHTGYSQPLCHRDPLVLSLGSICNSIDKLNDMVVDVMKTYPSIDLGME